MEKLYTLLEELESKIPDSSKINTSVSATSVGWHIEHVLMANSQILTALKQSKPDNYKWKFNLKRIIVFGINKIPRGKARAPKSVQPSREITAENLKTDIQVLKAAVTTLSSLQPNNYFEHPYFGKLNSKAAIRFLNIHTKHHLDIINDILKS
jgi:hypothetical protein